MSVVLVGDRIRFAWHRHRRGHDYRRTLVSAPGHPLGPSWGEPVSRWACQTCVED